MDQEKLEQNGKHRPIPSALRKRCSKQAWLALGMAALTTLMIYNFRTWNYAIGYAGALYILWPAFSIRRDFLRGKIKKERLLCTKVHQSFSAKHATVHYTRVKGKSIGYFRTLDTQYPENRIYSFILTPEHRHQLCEDLVYNIYIHVENPEEVLAWEVLGTL